jgi:nucleoredoxin
LQKAGKEFEIIFVSADRDKNAFTNYFKSMSWLAVPFDSADVRKRIEARAKVKGVPTLLLYSANGSLLTKDGRKVISEGMVMTFCG